MPTLRWKDAPDEHDYPAALSYLSLVFEPQVAARLANALQQAAQPESFKAKDILRASGLPLLAQENKYVAADIAGAETGKKLSPVLLVRREPLQIADGYHRVCASYYPDENADIPCRIVSR